MGLLDSIFTQGGGLLSGIRPDQLGGGLPLPPMPPAAQQSMAQAIPAPPQSASPGLLDRLSAGFGGFVDPSSGGILPSLAALIGGIATGQRQDPRGIAQADDRILLQHLAPKIGPAAALAALRNPKILEAYFGQNKQTDDIKEFEYAKQQGFKGSLQDWMANKRGGAGEFGLTPIWGTDAQGNAAFIQPGKQGTPIQPKLPEGFKIARDPIKIDAGTHYVLIDPQTRQPIGQVPKNIAEAKAQEKIGAGQGDAAESLTSMRSKMPGLEKVVKQLDALSETATYTLSGQGLDFARRQLGMDPRAEAIARKQYVAMVDNQVLPLLRDTFGAAFTEREGATLRATLGDPDVSPKEKQAVLKAFIEQKRRDIEALESRTGNTPSPQPTVRKYNPTTGKIE